MTAKLAVAAIAIAAAGIFTATLWGKPDMLRKLVPALIGIGLAAYGIALVVANGSC